MRRASAAGLAIVFFIFARPAGAQSDHVYMRPDGPHFSLPLRLPLFFAPASPLAQPMRRAATGSTRSSGAAAEASPVRALIARSAATHGVPVPLADAVARIESRYNPHALHRGNYGLMQIRLQTARGEGFSGPPSELLNAETNAHYGVKHLARAWRMANGDVCGTIMRYQSGLRATRMSAANVAYCARAKALMAGRR